MKRLLSLVTAGIVVSTLFAGSAEAGEQWRGRHDERDRQESRRDYREDSRRDDRREVGRGRYFRGRDVVVIREYYRPSYRSLPPGLQKRYDRSGYLPPGWAKRMRPLPVYVERDMVRVPRGYHRGVIDGRVVVYDDRGFILDIAVLF